MDTTSTWGTYTPPKNSLPLRLLIASGTMRGKLKRSVISYWQRHFGNLVDIEVRGVKYRLNLENNVTDRKILAQAKEYDSQELQALKAACRGKVFVDIGANTGYYALAIAKSGAEKVLAIEPNPPTLDRLRYNISINQLADQITVLPIGIGEEGSFELFSSGDLGSASLLEIPGGSTTKTTITTRPLMTVLAEHNILQIGGLKIDVEGFEDRALLPFFRNSPEILWPDCIVLEHCNRTSWQEDVVGILTELKYRISITTRGNTVLSKP